MTIPQASRQPAQIPRFVRRLNEFAESRGVDVDVRVGPYSNDPAIRLWSEWRTSREKFLSLGLLQQSQRLPCKRGVVIVPGNVSSHCSEMALLAGDLTVTAGSVLWEIDSGPAEFTLAVRDGVEIVTYANETLYHGSVEALVATGIDAKRFPLGKRTSKRSPIDDYEHPAPKWRTRRQLDGSMLYAIENPKALLVRQEERARWQAQYVVEIGRLAAPVATKPRPNFLRLVVDNDRTN